MTEWLARAFTFEPRPGRGVYRDIEVTSPAGRTVRMYESPAGRTFRVYIDGVEWIKGADKELPKEDEKP